MKINKVVYNYSYTTEWNVDKSNKCIICYNELNECCNNCNQSSECKPLILLCKHIYHEHCVEDLINKAKENENSPTPVCPLCRNKIEILNCSFNIKRESETKKLIDEVLGDESVILNFK